MENRQSLKLINIHHKYNNITALNGVDFDLYRGEIHALTGDHRAGKSTLAKILTGHERKQSGYIYLNNEEINTLTPKSAIKHKIGMVYQEQNIIPSMSAVENIYIGRMPHFYISKKDRNAMTYECKKLFKTFSIDIDADIPVYQLTDGERQVIEIARVLSLGTDIIIVDEISRRFTPTELDMAFKILRACRDQGKSVIYITSNIDEIFKIADRVTVLKEGVRRGTEAVNAIDRSRLINMAYSFALNLEDEKQENDKLHFLNRYDESIIKDLPVGMILLDSENNLLLSNPAADKVFDINEDRKKHTFSQIIDKLEKKIQTEIIEQINNHKLFTWNKISLNNNKIIKLKSYPIYNEKDDYIGADLFIEDISVDYVTKEYLLRAEKVASTEELAAGVAHEINNPLGIIQNYVELLKLKERDDEDNSTITHIEKELNRIVEIIGSLLSFSRVNNQGTLKFNINLLLDEIIMLLGHKINDKNITITKNYIDKDIFITGQENKLKQLFMNLLINAIEAVLDHGKIELGIKKDKTDNLIGITISDNGYGIPIDIQKDIFNPFYTTKMTKTNTGLGLSICQYIIENHEGLITFTSKPGKGTVFHVQLPLQTS
ncbi:MAG: ATP-binding cassette domain-containing protein [Spirochaetales bacterium]|nr:ATP-binding cassette domain-containing protein [Spirochaetales bacterium]